ncbi:MBL fold metallo-hydrolase [Pandoraea captiosa]|uniref:MBL fold metallo-hydrolase n=1 Tax=Pandoraea captiosa TaxID=2508302 RepID=A0A5E5AEF8_9BURK|nr:MBL fold metallo-hydrolase [Pandoraea captiosa]VVE71974.1 MBL fold metallo-hydrolase [Pandoraea captiosa]
MKNVSLTFRVGDATVTRVDETAFALAPDVLFPEWNASAGHALQAALSSASLDLDNARVALRTHLWVVEVSGLTIVVDTAIGNGKVRPFSQLFDRLDNPVAQRFEAAGFRREQVDYVLLTHLHVDHVGWNTYWHEGRWMPFFPNATYVFTQREHDFFATPAGEARRMVFDDSVAPLVEAQRAKMLSDADAIDTGWPLVDGIRFLPTPGHSAGHAAIEITSQGQTALFSGDVMHSPVQVYRPEWSSTFCLDPHQARASRQWLLDYAVTTGATVFPAHFPQTSAGKVRRTANGLAWQYVEGERASL